jgi:hypothetical protein
MNVHFLEANEGPQMAHLGPEDLDWLRSAKGRLNSAREKLDRPAPIGRQNFAPGFGWSEFLHSLGRMRTSAEPS